VTSKKKINGIVFASKNKESLVLISSLLVTSFFFLEKIISSKFISSYFKIGDLGITHQSE